MSNGESSNEDNPRFENLKVENEDSLRFNNQDNNLRREFGSHKDKSKGLRFSNLDALSLKENLKEGR
jgi:hypothetical protein